VTAHVSAHPIRLLVTTGVVVVVSWFAAGMAIVLAIDAGKAADVAVCLQINELRRELYVAAADLGVPETVRERFLPTQDCGALP
jgi:hypothetical protein